MTNRIKEIEEKWPFLFPLDHKTKGELVDAVIKANHDISFLLQRIKELEIAVNKAEHCACTFEEDGDTVKTWCGAHAIWRDRVKELEKKNADLIRDSKCHTHFISTVQKEE